MISAIAPLPAQTTKAGESPASAVDGLFAGIMMQIGEAQPKAGGKTLSTEGAGESVKILTQALKGTVTIGQDIDAPVDASLAAGDNELPNTALVQGEAGDAEAHAGRLAFLVMTPATMLATQMDPSIPVSPVTLQEGTRDVTIPAEIISPARQVDGVAAARAVQVKMPKGVPSTTAAAPATAQIESAPQAMPGTKPVQLSPMPSAAPEGENLSSPPAIAPAPVAEATKSAAAPSMAAAYPVMAQNNGMAKPESKLSAATNEAGTALVPQAAKSPQAPMAGPQTGQAMPEATSAVADPIATASVAQNTASAQTLAQPAPFAAIADNVAVRPIGGEAINTAAGLDSLPPLPAPGEAGLAARDAAETAWLERTAQIVMSKLDGGASQARFRLTPEALGTVDVDVSFDGGTPQINFTVANEAARSTLDSALNRLGDMLERNLAGEGQADTGTSSRQSSARQEQQAAQGRRPDAQTDEGERPISQPNIQDQEDGRVRLFA